MSSTPSEHVEAQSPAKANSPSQWQAVVALSCTSASVLLAALLITAFTGDEHTLNAFGGLPFVVFAVVAAPLLNISGIIFGHVAFAKDVAGDRILAAIALIIGYSTSAITVLGILALIVGLSNIHG